MRISTTRHALAPSQHRRRRAALALAAGLLAAIVPSAARADSAPACRTLLHSTPPASVDLDGDGYPDYSAPRILDVTLCSETWASYVTYPPRVERCFVGWHPTCVAVYTTVSPVDPDVGARADLCYTVEGQSRTCTSIDTAPLEPALPPQTICIGVDLYGGYPCNGSVFTFE